MTVLRYRLLHASPGMRVLPFPELPPCSHGALCRAGHSTVCTRVPGYERDCSAPDLCINYAAVPETVDGADVVPANHDQPLPILVRSLDRVVSAA